MEMLIGLCVFLLTLLVLYQASYLIKKLHKPEQRLLHKRLAVLSLAQQNNQAVDILRKRTLSELPWLNEILHRISFISRLDRLQRQANTTRPLGVFVILSALLFFAGLLAAVIMRINPFAMLVPSLFLASAPFFQLVRKRRLRMQKFERQLPDALDFIARSLKAGHAFTGGLRLVADEFGDPVGTEFSRTLDEINFGMAVPEALVNLEQRIDCDDLKLFVVSVIIHRESGGNLAKMLESLAKLMRERFKFQGRVRVLSAEGRMSAMVLLGMPFFLVGVISLMNPEYVNVLFTDPIGMKLILAALVMMSCGALVIKKIVAIRV